MGMSKDVARRLEDLKNWVNDVKLGRDPQGLSRGRRSVSRILAEAPDQCGWRGDGETAPKQRSWRLLQRHIRCVCVCDGSNSIFSSDLMLPCSPCSCSATQPSQRQVFDEKKRCIKLYSNPYTNRQRNEERIHRRKIVAGQDLGGGRLVK